MIVNKEVEKYFNIAKSYYYENNYEESLKNINKVIAMSPEHAIAYYNRGSIYHRLRDYKKAIYDYKKARILQPHFTEPIFAIACINIELGNYNQAIEYYEIVIGEKKDDKKAYVNIGISYYIIGEYENAIAHYLDALDLDKYKKLTYLNINIGIAYIKLKRYDIAKKYFEEYLKIIKDKNSNKFENETIKESKEVFVLKERNLVDDMLFLTKNIFDSNLLSYDEKFLLIDWIYIKKVDTQSNYLLQ